MASRIVVLISGGGSNLADFLDRRERVTTAPFDVVAVGADREAPGLNHARVRGIDTFVRSLADFPDRDRWGDALADVIESYRADLVILSGFMKILPPGVVERLAPGLINTHPSYLPQFPGAHAVADQLAAGVSEAGASVIRVDCGVDTGDILAQERVAVSPDDTVESLHARIKAQERQLLWNVVNDPTLLRGSGGVIET